VTAPPAPTEPQPIVKDPKPAKLQFTGQQMVAKGDY
jgi:hypothetical protein